MIAQYDAISVTAMKTRAIKLRIITILPLDVCNKTIYYNHFAT